MELSVVVPTLNGRERLARCLDALAEHAPAAEVVVVNGPSTDGTTGMVRDRDGVDVLVELADRNINASRNAGIDRADGDVIALLSHDLTVETGWYEAIREAVTEGAAGVSGPTHRPRRAGVETEEVETRTIAGREVTYFNSENFALTRAALDALDGFDEYLETGGARDAAHRLAGIGHRIAWDAAMCARREVEADGGQEPRQWDWRYRALAYRLVKNYGLRPTVVRRVTSHAGADALDALRDVVRGEGRPSSWLGNGRDVLAGAAQGAARGVVARLRDRTPRRNPNGLSAREDRAVAVYDRR
jgi:glycosyltransferase involved in cell wall biosynthesis